MRIVFFLLYQDKCNLHKLVELNDLLPIEFTPADATNVFVLPLTVCVVAQIHSSNVLKSRFNTTS